MKATQLNLIFVFHLFVRLTIGKEIPPSSRLIAFGRDGQLGGFWNYPDDKFGPLSLSFFSGEIPTWMKQETSSRFNWSRSVVINSRKREKEGDEKEDFDDIFKNFETKEDSMMHYRLNLLLGFTEVPQRGLYLTEASDKYDKNTVVGAVTFAWGTVYEKLDADWNSLTDKLQFPFELGKITGGGNGENSNSKPARSLAFSHVIMGSQFGAICTIRFLLKLETEGFFFNDKYGDKSWEEAQELEEQALAVNKKEIQGHLEKQMKFLRAKNGKGRELFQKYFKQNPSAPKFQIDIYGDIPVPKALQMTGSGSGSGSGSKSSKGSRSEPENEESKSRVKDVYAALDFIEQVPKIIRKINGGKGHPISYDVVTIRSILQATEGAVSQKKTGQENGNTKTFESAPTPVSL